MTLVLATTGSTASASGSPPPADNANVWCVSTTGAKACFVAYGDHVWVKDTKANGASAAGTIIGGNWNRRCMNDLGEAGGWVRCDFDVPEYQNAELWAVNNPFIGNQASMDIYTSNPI
ncbi:hypothetical protein [Micromonospora zamorensis]|uniref:hypothetical protein n=1 Tax=Micromonospora zamorensis TaxID=709883 RepID=UPI003CF28E69